MIAENRRHRLARLAWRFLALSLVAWSTLPEPAAAFTRRIGDGSNPKGDGMVYPDLDPSDPGYPMQYAPYVFGREEGMPPRGPNPVPGPTFGSTDVDMMYDLVPVIHEFYVEKFNRNGPNGLGGLGNSPDPISTGSNVPFAEYRFRVNINGFAPQDCDADGPHAGIQYQPPGVNFCCGVITPDLVAHELNHFVWIHDFGTSPFDRGEYRTLDESMADFFGESFERYVTGTTDWKFTLNGVVLRDLADPTSLGYPDRYLSPHYEASTDIFATDYHHVNSTVLNYAAYLASEGGVFNGFDITGVGFDKVEQIWYRAQAEYFVPGVTYNEAYYHLIQAATDLYDATDVAEVTKALRAVELNVPRTFNGDFDADSDVDGTDFLDWQRGLGTSYSASLLQPWKTHFGETSPGGAGVPEPSTFGMFWAVAFSLSLRSFRRIQLWL